MDRFEEIPDFNYQSPVTPLTQREKDMAEVDYKSEIQAKIIARKEREQKMKKTKLVKNSLFVVLATGMVLVSAPKLVDVIQDYMQPDLSTPIEATIADEMPAAISSFLNQEFTDYESASADFRQEIKTLINSGELDQVKSLYMLADELEIGLPMINLNKEVSKPLIIANNAKEALSKDLEPSIKAVAAANVYQAIVEDYNLPGLRESDLSDVGLPANYHLIPGNQHPLNDVSNNYIFSNQLNSESIYQRISAQGADMYQQLNQSNLSR